MELKDVIDVRVARYLLVVARYLLVSSTLRKIKVGELLVETESAKYDQIGEQRCQGGLSESHGPTLVGNPNCGGHQKNYSKPNLF